MTKIYTRESSEIKEFYSDSLVILEISELINKNVRPTLVGQRFYTDAQLAEQLNISRRTLQDYRDNGLIAYYRLDGKILYADRDVDDFLKSSYRPKY